MINTGRQTLLDGELRAVTSREGLKLALNTMCEMFSYEHVSLVRVPQEQDKALAPLMQETTLPLSHLRDIDRNQLLPSCPLAERLRKSLLPVSWTLVELRKTSSRAPVAEICASLERHGITGGAIFSQYLADGHRYSVRFDGTRQPLNQTDINELSLLCLSALDVFERLQKSKENSHAPLSARELEVVSWTSQGKTSVEIGQILSLSDHTVNAYLTNAIRKLDCVNRTQLVAKALRLKLII